VRNGLSSSLVIAKQETVQHLVKFPRTNAPVKEIPAKEVGREAKNKRKLQRSSLKNKNIPAALSKPASGRLLMVPVLNRRRPEAVACRDAEVGAGARGGLLGHPSQRDVALARFDLLLVGVVLLAQVLQAAHLRHARERLGLTLVVPRQALPARTTKALARSGNNILTLPRKRNRLFSFCAGEER
jgi:hypothetical protein